MLNDFDLTGKRVLITGAGRGIGHGIALAMAEAGADVGVTSLGGDTAVEVAEEVTALGRKGFGWAADATKVGPMETLRDQAFEALGGVDILVNCLGDAIRGTVSDMPGSDGHSLTEPEWHTVIDLNLTQAYVGCHVFGPHLLAKGEAANVINISSFAAIRPAANMVAYAAGKAGLTRFTESLALEWAPFGVRVNAIAPGNFPDPDAMPPEQYERRMSEGGAGVPLGRLGHPREVGLMAVFLASDAASYVTGQTFAIDGGRTLV
jgi:NAD(P)-dependent dehydrogenase (short-subunit alcohol dehydrogenase family)